MISETSKYRSNLISWHMLNAALDMLDDYPCSESSVDLFSVESTEKDTLIKNLNEEKVPDGLEGVRKQFQERSITLSPKAVKDTMVEKTKWRIVDANQTYYILSEGQKLNVYTRGKRKFEDQCAIRMGAAMNAFDLPNFYMVSFKGATCGLKGHDSTEKHQTGHILRARELANWLRGQTKYFGNVKIYKKATPKDFENRRGIMFIQKPTEAGGLDHIDLWDGRGLKQKTAKISWISACDQVWFWDLWPYSVDTTKGKVDVYPDLKGKPDLVKAPFDVILTNRHVEIIDTSTGEEYVKATVNMVNFGERLNTQKYNVIGKYNMGWIKSDFIAVPPKPPASTKGVVTAKSLHIRKDHNNSSAEVGGKRNGDEVTILDTWSDGKDTWAQLGIDQWAAIEFNGETLIEERT